ncbi:MAG: hypothetical protein KC431_10680, partial [Myxococcales bacterium]|nr:hypothetical protein [Myxococcales bacterium]
MSRIRRSSRRGPWPRPSCSIAWPRPSAPEPCAARCSRATLSRSGAASSRSAATSAATSARTRTPCVCAWPSWKFKKEDDYQRFIRLVSHEFFHVWNVKRVRPKILGPFDYSREQHTKALW